MEDILSSMDYGHTYTALHDYNMELCPLRAREISEYDYDHHICIGDDNGSYIVIQKTPRITGDVYVLTKLFTPLEHRGKGYIKELLDQAPTPLVRAPETLEQIR